jgi:hypothetical protein
MADNPLFSPVQICQMFGISKTSLLRWEREGKIPLAHRTLEGERQYTIDDVNRIAEIRIGHHYNRAVTPYDPERLEKLHEEITRLKILYIDPQVGLLELAAHKPAPEGLIRDLLIKASQLDLKDPIYKDIIEFLYAQIHPKCS